MKLTLRRWYQRRMNGDIIRVLVYLFQAHIVYFLAFAFGVIYKWIVGDYPHSKSFHSLGHFPPDFAKTNDAQGLSINFCANEILPLPLLSHERSVGLQNFSGQSQDESARQLTSTYTVTSRRTENNEFVGLELWTYLIIRVISTHFRTMMPLADA